MAAKKKKRKPQREPQVKVEIGEPQLAPEYTVETGDAMILEPGNIDLRNRPYVWHDDGSASTVRSMGVNLGDVGGPETLIPTVSDDGSLLTPEEAIDEYIRTGKHLGQYSTVEASNEAGRLIHEDQERNPPANTMARLDGQRTVPFSTKPKAKKPGSISVHIGEPTMQPRWDVKTGKAVLK